MVTLEDTRQALADEWERRSPSSPSEIAAFYRDSECLRHDLDAWHSTTDRQEWTQALVAVAAGNKAARVLDVGAGVGHDIQAVKDALPFVEAVAVEPNDALRRELSGDIETFSDITQVPGQFDLVVLIDVLEHVPDPETLINEVAERVKVGGLLVEATATHDQSTPLHLPHLADWEPIKSFQALGFRPVETVGRLAVWQRDIVVEEATVMVVAHREIAAPTVECLFGLVQFGWPIALRYGDALIDRARAKAVAHWYREETTDVFLMVDDDIVFKAEDAARVVQLARDKRSIACGAYPVGDGGHMASRGWPGQELHWGKFPPVEIRWPATGFMAVHRDVIDALVKTMDECYSGEPDAFWPMFQPFAYQGMYLSEDYSFGERARQLGFATWMDPKTILHHLKIHALSVHNMKGVKREGESA